MKIFGRNPTLWIAIISQVVTLAGTLGLHWLNGVEAALIVVAINAGAGVLNAWTVRPIAPAAFTYFIGSLIAVAAAYGLHVPVDTVAGINAVVIAILSLLTYGNVSPQETIVSRA